MHSKYFNKYNVEVPSVTTILKLLNKPNLIEWANYMGFMRKNVNDILKSSAYVGTFVHSIIEADLLNKYLIYEIPKKEVLDKINNHFKNYIKWKSHYTIDPIFMEKSFSDDLFGGTLDFYGMLNNKKTILDFKTSKKIHMSMFLQSAGYTILVEKHGFVVEQIGVVSFSETNVNEGYILRENFQEYIDVFLHLVELFTAITKLVIEGGWPDAYTN